MTRARLRVLLTAAGLLCGQTVLAADPTSAPTFAGAYLWTQAVWGYVPQGDGWVVSRGDAVGGRAVAGLGFGRFGAEMRVDVSGLQGSFQAEDPQTYTTLESYGALHYVLLARDGVQIGPAAVVGSVASEHSQGGIGLNVLGLGVRLAGYGAEVHLLCALHRELPLGGWRLSASAHVPLKAPLYGVGDIVTGRDGMARVGLAVRLK